jgi:hypothetical protein
VASQGGHAGQDNGAIVTTLDYRFWCGGCGLEGVLRMSSVDVMRFAWCPQCKELVMVWVHVPGPLGTAEKAGCCCDVSVSW